MKNPLNQFKLFVVEFGPPNNGGFNYFRPGTPTPRIPMFVVAENPEKAIILVNSALAEEIDEAPAVSVGAEGELIHHSGIDRRITCVRVMAEKIIFPDYPFKTL